MRNSVTILERLKDRSKKQHIFTNSLCNLDEEEKLVQSIVGIESRSRLIKNKDDNKINTYNNSDLDLITKIIKIKSKNISYWNSYVKRDIRGNVIDEKFNKELWKILKKLSMIIKFSHFRILSHSDGELLGYYYSDNKSYDKKIWQMKFNYECEYINPDFSNSNSNKYDNHNENFNMVLTRQFWKTLLKFQEFVINQ